ncbi:hypothetical protein CRUP_023807 [Coryphaenoides rupestris]|nr:hypothetical protein CRUP_023807 [Coryphaenoides rupestris]
MSSSSHCPTDRTCVPTRFIRPNIRAALSASPSAPNSLFHRARRCRCCTAACPRS